MFKSSFIHSNYEACFDANDIQLVDRFLALYFIISNKLDENDPYWKGKDLSFVSINNIKTCIEHESPKKFLNLFIYNDGGGLTYQKVEALCHQTPDIEIRNIIDYTDEMTKIIKKPLNQANIDIKHLRKYFAVQILEHLRDNSKLFEQTKNYILSIGYQSQTLSLDSKNRVK